MEVYASQRCFCIVSLVAVRSFGLVQNFVYSLSPSRKNVVVLSVPLTNA
jgi:hypothetical protein